MRPKRKKIKFTEDSVNDLLQEIYNDTHIIRTRIVRILTKWEAKIKENGEIAAMGDQIIKLISEEGKSQDKKIALLKILREIVYTNKDDTKSSDDSKDEISDSRRDELYDMVENAINKRR